MSFLYLFVYVCVHYVLYLFVCFCFSVFIFMYAFIYIHLCVFVFLPNVFHTRVPLSFLHLFMFVPLLILILEFKCNSPSEILFAYTFFSCLVFFHFMSVCTSLEVCMAKCFCRSLFSVYLFMCMRT